MAAVRDEYLRALYKLSKSDPSAWATFVEAFKAYASDEIEKMASSPADSASMSIGMARRMRDMRNDFLGIDHIPEALKK